MHFTLAINYILMTQLSKRSDIYNKSFQTYSCDIKISYVPIPDMTTRKHGLFSSFVPE